MAHSAKPQTRKLENRAFQQRAAPRDLEPPRHWSSNSKYNTYKENKHKQKQTNKQHHNYKQTYTHIKHTPRHWSSKRKYITIQQQQQQQQQHTILLLLLVLLLLLLIIIIIMIILIIMITAQLTNNNTY